MKKYVLFLFFSFFLIFTTGCDNLNGKDRTKDQQPSTEDYLINLYQKGIGDKGGYMVEAFIKQKPIPDGIDRIMTLEPFGGKYEGIQIHYSSDGSGKQTDYLKIFKMNQYPFYIVVKKDSIILKTHSADKVIQYMKKNP